MLLPATVRCLPQTGDVFADKLCILLTWCKDAVASALQLLGRASEAVVASDAIMARLRLAVAEPTSCRTRFALGQCSSRIRAA